MTSLLYFQIIYSICTRKDPDPMGIGSTTLLLRLNNEEFVTRDGGIPKARTRRKKRTGSATKVDWTIAFLIYAFHRLLLITTILLRKYVSLGHAEHYSLSSSGFTVEKKINSWILKNLPFNHFVLNHVLVYIKKDPDHLGIFRCNKMNQIICNTRRQKHLLYGTGMSRISNFSGKINKITPS